MALIALAPKTTPPRGKANSTGLLRSSPAKTDASWVAACLRLANTAPYPLCQLLYRQINLKSANNITKLGYNLLMSEKPMVYVALLRGINVGGNNKVSMAELKKCLEALGFSNVKTYINSGNVVFTDHGADTAAIAAKIENSLDQTFKLPIGVVVKNLAEMQAIVQAIPAAWKHDVTMKHNVIFLRPSIDKPSVLDGMTPKADREEVHYVPGALLWAAKLKGLGTTEMFKLIKRPIYKDITVRNLNSTLKIYDLMLAIPIDNPS